MFCIQHGSVLISVSVHVIPCGSALILVSNRRVLIQPKSYLSSLRWLQVGKMPVSSSLNLDTDNKITQTLSISV
jgi:hypothetical protein